MSDGLTVPFALAAGLASAAQSTQIVVTAGLAEIAAGAIAMGLGGYLAGRSEVEHYAQEKRREEREIREIPLEEEREIIMIFDRYGITAEEAKVIVNGLKRKPDLWRDFMMRFELGLEEPDPRRALHSALTIGGAYILGGLFPLMPYMLSNNGNQALTASVVVTIAALLVFGFVKGHLTNTGPWQSALRTAAIGGIAALAAFMIAKTIS
jgi:VIT1/CCC1 family predicted Fe2+/Mn2+ transporter